MASPRPATINRHLAVVLLLVTLCVPAASAHGPVIPAYPSVEDGLVSIERDWDARPRADEPGVVDLLATSRVSGAANVAFRVHGDVALVEGVLTTTPNHVGVAPTPVYNVGVRIQAVSFDPPLVLQDGSNLTTVILGPLEWSTPEIGIVESGVVRGLRVNVGANVTAPNAHGTSPQHGGAPGNASNGSAANEASSSESIGIRIDWATEVVERPRPDDNFGTIGAATATIEVHVHVIGAQTGGSEPRPHVENGTRARLALVFDWGGSAPGRTAPPSDGSLADASGVWLRRSDAYAFLVATGDVVFDAPAFNRIPGSEEQVLLSPVAVNATVALASPMDATPADAVWSWSAGLGFAQNATVFAGADEVDDGRGPDERPTPGPPVLPGVLLVLSGVGAWRRRQRARV